MRLRLLQGRWAKCEIHIDISEISVALLISDPELIEYGGVGQLAQSTIDLIGSEVRLLCSINEMRDDARLGHHLRAEHFLNFVRNLISESRATSEQIGNHLPRILRGFEQSISCIPGEQAGDDDDGARQKHGNEKN